MQISEKNRELIEYIIQNNELYTGNEHLFEKFYKEITRRTYLVLDSKSEDEKPSYLKDVAQKIMGNVIEREQTSIEYRKMLQNASSDGIVSLKKIAENEIHKSDNIIDFRRAEEKNYTTISDPIEAVENKKEAKPAIQKILEAIYLIHQKEPLKYYFQMFYMKYYEQKQQSDIAKTLNITQSELSLRFVKMLDELKDMGIKF